MTDDIGQGLLSRQAKPGESPARQLSTEAFLAHLFRRGVQISASDGTLKCSGPGDQLNAAVSSEIRDRKPEILAFLAASGSKEGDSIPPVPESELVPSPAQERLWIAETLYPGSAYTIPFALEARGDLDLERVERALTGLARRHDALRLRVMAREGQPVPFLSPEAEVPLVVLDAAGLDAAELDRLIAAEAARPFDLSAEPPLRLWIARSGDRDLLLFNLHHIAADGSSVEMLMRDFAVLYRTGKTDDLPALPIRYVDFAAWQRSGAVRESEADGMEYWAARLGDDLAVTRLTTDFPRPEVQSFSGATHDINIPGDLTARLRGVGADCGASLFSVLLTAFDVLIYRYTGQSDILVGSPFANRTRPETENLAGLFVNPLPLRSRISPDLSFRENLRAVHGDVLGALDHQDVPFERLVSSFQPTRDASASPLFQLKFQLDRAPREVMDLGGVELRRHPLARNTARHDLSLDLVETRDGVAGHIEYCTDLFSGGTIAALAGHFAVLLNAIAEAPDKAVAFLDMLSEAEISREREAWNDTASPLDQTLRFPALFEDWANRRPDAVAVEYVVGDQVQTETYGALNRRANRLAHVLRAQGFGAEDVIAIALERGVDMVAAWLGILKSGAAYMPVDPAYPRDRQAYMLEDSGAALVLTHAQIDLPKHITRLNLDQGWPQGDESDPVAGQDANNLAYVIYTSGSTGRPKGVEVPHAGLINLTQDKLRRCGVRAGDRVMSFFNFAFDASIPDLVMALGSGARLILTPAEDVLPGDGFARILRDRKATHLTITPSALAATPSDDLPDLRMVLVGGEPPAPDLIERWSAGRLFINAYGPTETTVNASMVACGNGAPVEPRLLPPANKQLYVLDANLQLLPPGCWGELCIGGVGLARGYRGQPAKTAAAFVPDPFGPPGARLYRTGDRAIRQRDGSIRVSGRLDDQVKIRGYRIEPGEVARACSALPGVDSAAVDARDLDGKGLRLVAYVVGSTDEATLRRGLRNRLPRHMIPDAFVFLDQLPLTANGKLDKRALPLPSGRSGKGRPPKGETETRLAAIFGQVLGQPEVSAEDDFFDLGGTSLLATRLIAAIEDGFGRRLRPVELFEAASVADLALLLDTNDPAPRGESGWQDDITLDPSIRATRPIPLPEGLPSRIFLTGATGFVGAHILAELLDKGVHRVFCLTRGDGIAPIRAALGRYGLWQDAFESHITPVCGDLEKPGLGLSGRARACIAARAEAILHCGAVVHHLSPYRALRAANVQAVSDVLALAADAAVPVYHVSTLSALMVPDGAQAREAQNAADLAPPEGGYNLSKWVAEHLVSEANRRGIPTTIFRLGSVAGHSRVARFNTADLLARQLRGYLATGIAPEGGAWINILPVDHVAAAITRLLADPATSGKTFHLTHSTPVCADLLFDACAAEGHPIRRVCPAEWDRTVQRITRDDPAHPLASLAAIGGPQGFAGACWPYDSAATRAALGPALPEPALSPDLFRHYVRGVLAAGHTPTKEQTIPDITTDYDAWAWLYDRTLGPDYRDLKMDFLNRVMLDDLPKGARVLDLCCGTGQMMMRMADRGLDVIGIDISAEMLRHARQNVPGAVLIEGDARDFAVDAPVSGVVCASASLNHMSGLGDLRRVFDAVFAALEPGGCFVFDINHPAQMARHWRGVPAAGEIAKDHAWMITPRYDSATGAGAFAVDMYRRPKGGSSTGSALWRALIGRPVMRRNRLERLANFAAHHPDWQQKSVEYPVRGHAIADVLAGLRDAGFAAHVETLKGARDIDDNSAACFICRKPSTPEGSAE